MPLSEKARIEVYLPDLPTSQYQGLLTERDSEFTYAFGGSTVVRGLEGSFLSVVGIFVQDRITRVYTDTPFSLKRTFPHFPFLPTSCAMQCMRR